MLDFVCGVLETDEDGDEEHFAAGVEVAEGIFHIGASGTMGYLEGPRGVGAEEGLDDLARLVAAGVVGVGEYGHLKIVGEPGGESFRIALGEIF